MEPPAKKQKISVGDDGDDAKKKDAKIKNENMPPTYALNACAMISAKLAFPSLCFMAALEVVHKNQNKTLNLSVKALAYVLWIDNREQYTLSNGTTTTKFRVVHDQTKGEPHTRVVWQANMKLTNGGWSHTKEYYLCRKDGLEWTGSYIDEWTTYGGRRTGCTTTTDVDDSHI